MSHLPGPRAASLVVLVALLHVACTDAPAPPKYTELPVAACGMPPYTLLDPATLGAELAHDELLFLDLDAAAINSVLRDRGYASLLPVPYGSRVFRLRYTTQDRGRAIEATALLAIPANAELPAGDLPMTVFLHGTTGFSDACAPSRDLGGQATGVLLASLGFVAVLPDYIGMNGFGAASTTSHGYLVGEQVALGSWDAVRAARKLLVALDTGVTASNEIVVWGGSQGGHAALFTELYAPYYAPEFEVPGVVALVPPTTLPALVRLGVSSYSPPTLATASVLTAMRRWYGAPADMKGVLTDDAPYRFASTIDDELFMKDDECKTGQGYQSVNDHPELQQPGLVYREDFIAGVKDENTGIGEPWGCYLRENSLATSSVKPLRHTPTYMAYSELDTLVVTAPMRDDFDRLCASGYRMKYRECASAGHTQGAQWSLPEQLAWIRARLAGEPLGELCVRDSPVCCAGSPKETCVP